MNLIFAGNYAQAMLFVREMNWSQKDYRIISLPEHIMGLEGFTLYRVGTWTKRPDALEIMELVRSRRNVQIADRP